MKTILFILLFLVTFISYGQVLDINKSGTTTNVGGTLESSGYFLNEMPHCFFSKRDTLGFNLSLTTWGWYKVTGLTDKESHEINYLTGDTIQYQGTRACHLDVRFFISGTTSNANDDVWIRCRNLRSGEIIYGYALSGGSGGFTSWRINFYDTDVQPLDKFIFDVRNKTNGNDLTIYAVTIDMSVRHFE